MTTHTAAGASSPAPERPVVQAAGSPDSDNITLSELLLTLRKRKWVVAAVIALGIAVAFYQAFTQPRLYEAYGRIEIRSGSSNQYRLEAATSLDNSPTVRLNSEALILKSDSLLLAVAQDLDLANSADFLGKKPLAPVDLTQPAARERILGMMQGAINVTGVVKTDVVLISCRTYNANLSAEIVNKLIEEYISRSFNSRVTSSSRVSNLLTKQLEDLKRDVESSQQKMIDVGKRLGVLTLDPQHNQVTAGVEDLTRAASAAEVARINAESRYRVLSTMDPNSLDQSIAAIGNTGGSQLAQLRAQLETVRAQYAGLSANDGPNLPRVKALREQLQQLTKAVSDEQQRVLAQARETYVAARANEEQTHAALETAKSEVFKLRDDLVQYNIYQREFDSNRTLYESLLERLRSAGVQAGLESTEIDVIDPALPPATPSMRRKSTILIIDTLIAAVFGIIIAFILESLDTGLHSVAEIEQVSGLPSLALIPQTRRTGVDTSQLSVAERNIATLSSPKSQFAESFRALRTSLLLSTAGKLPEVILMTSATPSEGKTTVSVNLASVFAQGDARVLLIDADLRRPTVHHRFGLNGQVGLTSVLTGSVAFEDAIQRLPQLPNLDILVSGPVPPLPTEMLSSSVMTNLLERVRGEYTHVLIDSPPVLSVTDGIVLARHADAVVLVVRHRKSNKSALRRARDLLVRSGASVTGIAINAVDLKSPEYYGYYGYYGYSGYGSAGVDANGWEPGSDSPNGKPRSRRRRKEGDGA